MLVTYFIKWGLAVVTLHYKNLKLLAIIYAGIPIIIFMLGWLNIIYGILFSGVLIAGIVFLFLKNNDDDGEIKKFTLSRKKFFIIIAIAFFWCIFAGQGGFFHQTSDQTIRNAIFYDLIVKPWPVTYNDGEALLSYYIAHWMVPSLVGKLVLFITGGSCFAAYLAGNIALLLWSSFGVAIVLLLFSMLSNTGKKTYPIISAIGFIFFSGMDILGRNILKSMMYSNHIEWWAFTFQYSSNSTCLFWVYNQTIVTWLMMLIIINEKKLKNLALAGIMIFPYGPFPFVGAFIICLIKVIQAFIDKIKKHEFTKAIKDLFSPQNIMSVLSIAPVFILYFVSNQIVSNEANSNVKTNLRLHDDMLGSFLDSNAAQNFIYRYILFILIEFGLFSILIMRRHKKDMLFWGINISLMIIPVIQMGTASDFSMRVSIPGLVYICLMLFRYIFEKMSLVPEKISSLKILKKQIGVILAALMVVIGAITPVYEFCRETSLTLKGINYSEQYSSQKSLEELDYGKNFTNEHYKDSAFYKISRH